ncbi:MAG: 2-C-methyl-D-erythritol 4-phosphate cytidylyltransferase [Clostridia bacterium]|nr:2-C-methyl-D-erythritol 4-phosphate cytidylyltransferase [Clostridia bacterium]
MKKKTKSDPFVSCIVAAGGKGSRMGADVNKIFLEYGDMPVLAHTLLALNNCSAIHEIILVTAENDLPGCMDIANEFSISKVKTITIGGATRQDSVRNGLKEVSFGADIVLIHDAARSLVTDAVICDVIQGVIEFGAAATGVPCKNTLKFANEQGLITGTPDRSTLYEIQTPQGFRRDLIVQAHEAAVKSDLVATDDCFLVESLGASVKITQGDYRNIKITTPEDLLLAEQFSALPR